MIHGKNICMECEDVISQCKCPGHNTTVHTVCEKCVKNRRSRQKLHDPAILDEAINLIALNEKLKQLTQHIEIQAKEIDRYRSLFYIYYSHYRILRDTTISYSTEPEHSERARLALQLIQTLEGSHVSS